MEERRRNKRIPLSALAVLLFDGDSGPLALQGTVSDISMSGVVLYLDTPLKGGAHVMLEIRFPVSGGEVRSETVKGTTVYSNGIHNVHYVGIEFDNELNPKCQSALYSRIQNILALS
jgi:hypothetical protein